jgi:transaldolase
MPAANPLCLLPDEGQSVWLDQLRREWSADGTLQAFIDQDCVRGVTSNPSIFKAALQGSAAYDEQIGAMVAQGHDPVAIFDRLTLDDIIAACDIFLPVFEATSGLDGYVSHEVSPALAYDTAGTIAEAKRLWQAVDRPNLMIKIPATNEGIPAIRACLREGINVNVTLMFSLCHYDAVVEAYLAGLEDRLEDGQPIASLASVASFFVSRVDSHVDARLAALADEGHAEAAALRGEAAVANAMRAWRRASEVFGGSRFARLARHGARVQRVLWASTSAKDPAYRDVKYVEELVGPETVNTLPLKTLEAFRDHGEVARTIDRDLAHADAVVARLCDLDIDLEEVGQTLSREGVDAFQAALDDVMRTVREQVASVSQPG